MTCFSIDELEKKFKKMKFLEITKDHDQGFTILQYICDKNNKDKEMLKLIRDIRNEKVLVQNKQDPGFH